MLENAKRSGVLVIDAGNSFIKWALYEGGQHRALSRHGQHRYDEECADLGLTRAFSGLQLNVNQVIAGSVASAKTERLLSSIIEQEFGCSISFQSVEPEFEGLSIAYRQPSSFGIDRWLALLGAQTLDNSAFCVADCGTALTLDCIDDIGQHLGGVIVPGFGLMTQSLLSETAKISQLEDDLPSSIFATTTGAAVNAGSTFALASILDRFVDEAKLLLSTTPLVVVTGGGRQRLINFSRYDLLEVPDLVLLGLAVVCDTQQS